MKNFQNITEKEIKTAGVTSLPTRPNSTSRYDQVPMTAGELKAAFDRLARVIIGRVNELQNVLNGVSEEHPGEYIKVPDPTGGHGNLSLYDFVMMFVNNTIANSIRVILSGSNVPQNISTVVPRIDVNVKSIESDINSINNTLLYDVCRDLYCGFSTATKSILIAPESKSGTWGECAYITLEMILATLGTGTITSEILADGAVAGAKLSDGAVTAEKIADGAVAEGHLSSEVSAKTVKNFSFDPLSGRVTLTMGDDSQKVIDLPTELIVRSGYFDGTAKSLVLVLANGQTISIPVSALLADLIGLPRSTADDSGKALFVGEDGDAEYRELPRELPEPTSDDIGKIATVVSEGAYELKNPVNIQYSSDGLEYYSNPINGGWRVQMGNCEDTDIIFPDTYGGLRVVTLPSFQDNTNITSIRIPKYASFYGRSKWFSGCSALNGIYYPFDYEGIGKLVSRACENCSNLKHIELPSYINEIGNSAFSGCSSLEYIIVNSETVATLGTTVFDGCVSLTRIFVPAALVDSYKSATNWAEYANKIYPYGAMCDIWEKAYERSKENDIDHERYEAQISSVRNRVIVDGVMREATELGRFNLRQCVSGTSVYYEIFGYDAFEAAGYSSPSELIIPNYYTDGVRISRIASGAFANHTALEHIVLGNSSIDYGAFDGCTRLKYVTILGDAVVTLAVFPECVERYYVAANLLEYYKAQYPELSEKIFANDIPSGLREGMVKLQEDINQEASDRVAAEQILQGNINNSTEMSYLVASLYAEEARAVAVPAIPMHTSVHVEIIVRNIQTQKSESDIVLVPYFPEIYFPESIYHASGLRGLVSELLVTRADNAYSFYFNQAQLKLADNYSFISARIRVLPSTVTQLL